MDITRTLWYFTKTTTSNLSSTTTMAVPIHFICKSTLGNLSYCKILTAIYSHGHNVQIVARGPNVYNRTRPARPVHNFLTAGVINSNANATALGYSNTTAGFPAVPMRRDTWLIAPNSYTVVRFQANNPGTWFIHCHMEWHMEAVSSIFLEIIICDMLIMSFQGLLLTLIEAPLELQATQPNIPAQMQSICKAQNIQLAGNAAGNTVDYLNLTGDIRVAPPPRGALYP